MRDTVSVADEDILTIDKIGCTVSGSLKGLLITFQEKVATTIAHVDTIAIKIWAIDGLTTAYSHTVVALRALTTVVP